MRICRVAVDDSLFFALIEGLADDGSVTDSSVVALLEGHPFGALVPEGRMLRAREARFVAPILPSKVIAVDRNFGEAQPTSSPLIVIKPSTSVIGPGEPIALPWQSESVVHEAELAVVIGRLCRDVPVVRVPEVVLGYTCANDITARDLQQRDGQWDLAKGFDSFCPLGPWIVTDFDPDDARITCSVNGQVRQSASTGDMVVDIAELIAQISAVMTLLPGDVILTGTPPGVGELVAGDEVSVSIEGIGTLRNPVIDRE